jgi:hypothetical protein
MIMFICLTHKRYELTVEGRLRIVSRTSAEGKYEIKIKLVHVYPIVRQ